MAAVLTPTVTLTMFGRVRLVSFLLSCAIIAGCGNPANDSDRLPPASAALQAKVAASLAAARPFDRHVWRDTAPVNADGTVTGLVEISRGDSTKWEFRIPLNRLEVDRVIPTALGGYPTNYGFLPRTISYDGDPADVLVVGPPIASGEIVTGRILALMKMVDDGDLDSKVVISPVDAGGQPRHALEAADRDRLTQFFNTYKRHQGKTTQITGWGSEADARAFLQQTAGFFSSAR